MVLLTHSFYRHLRSLPRFNLFLLYEIKETKYTDCIGGDGADGHLFPLALSWTPIGTSRTSSRDSIFHSKTNAEGYLWNTPTASPMLVLFGSHSWNPGELASDEFDRDDMAYGRIPRHCL